MNSPGYFPSVPGARPTMIAKPDEGNVIVCMVESMIYAITEEDIKTVVSAYGDVVRTVIYEKSGVWQAIVQYAEASSAKSAKQALEGHAIYEGGYNKLRIFQSSKEALNYAASVVSSPEYKLSDQDLSSARVVVDGDDYVRAHSDIGRGSMASLCGQPLPSCFIPTSIPPPGSMVSPPPVQTVVGPVYAAPGPYLPPAPRGQGHHGPMSASFHQAPIPMNIQQMQDARYPHQVPMTTYQQRQGPPRSMRNYPVTNHKPQGQPEERTK